MSTVAKHAFGSMPHQGARARQRCWPVLERLRESFVRWRERARQRRRVAECAALLGHRFAGDTLIGSDGVPRRRASL